MVSPAPNDVPLFQAVYSGYTTCIGCMTSERDDLATFASLNGEASIWGTMPGWVKSWVIHQPDKAKLARKLALYRMAAREYLIYGELVGQVDIEAPGDELEGTVYFPFCWIKSYSTTFQPVRGSIWRSYDGKSLGVVVVNTDAKPRPVKLSVVLSKYLDGAARQALGIYRMLPDGLVLERMADRERLDMALALDAHGVLIASARPAEDESQIKNVTPIMTKLAAGDAQLLSEGSAFDREMAERKTDVRLQTDFVEVLYPGFVDAKVVVANKGPADQQFQITWPGGAREEVVVTPRQRVVAERRIDLEKNEAGYVRHDIEVANGQLKKMLPFHVNLIAPVQVSLSGIALPVLDNTVAVFLPQDLFLEFRRHQEIDPGIHNLLARSIKVYVQNLPEIIMIAIEPLVLWQALPMPGLQSRSSPPPRP